MKNTFTLFLLAVSVCITSCSNDDDKQAAAISPYAGYYTVLQAESDVPVDLDDDGIAHTDLMVEIPYFNNVPYDIFLDERENGYKAMDFYIPHPHIPDDMDSFTVAYANGAFGVRYEYSQATNQITFTENFDTPYFQERGFPVSIQVLDPTTLKCVIRKDYYDYQIGGMKNILLTLVFKKQAE